jgi:anti-sigma B factor antagonist
MTHSIEERYFAVVLRIDGYFLGSREGIAFEQHIDELLATGKSRIVVDFSRATILDSTGISTLIRGLWKARAMGGDMRLACLESRVRSLFVTTRLLTNVFDAYATVEEAVESYSEMAREPGVA